MAESGNVFDKKLAPETMADKVEGVLEHLNLPPKVVAFIRRYLRIIQITLVVLIVLVVSWSLYDSYRERITQQAASALSAAMDTDKNDRETALTRVVSEFGSTSSALWARIELGHLDMQNGRYQKATEKYSVILSELDPGEPLYPLVLFAQAQALEAAKQFPEATAAYDELKTIAGYEEIGFSGKGRIEEGQGQIDRAIAIYNNFLLFAGDDPSKAMAGDEFKKKISRLKARQ